MIRVTDGKTSRLDAQSALKLYEFVTSQPKPQDEDGKVHRLLAIDQYVAALEAEQDRVYWPLYLSAAQTLMSAAALMISIVALVK